MTRSLKSIVKPPIVVFVCLLAAFTPEKINLSKLLDYRKFLTTVKPEFMITTSDALAWHQYKDQLGPRYSGNESWHKFLSFTKKRLEALDVKDLTANKWSRVMVQSVERPGIHNQPQGVWYGMEKLALEWDLPAYATMGIQGAYWSTAGRLVEFDKKQFVTQVAAMCQGTGELMLMDFN